MDDCVSVIQGFTWTDTGGGGGGGSFQEINLTFTFSDLRYS